MSTPADLNGSCPDMCTAICFYCDDRLDSTHEHDHYPTAQRHGGQSVVPIRRPCHNLKDRMPLNSWSPEMAAQAFMQAGPLGRLLIAKVGFLFSDIQTEVARQVDAA